MEVKGHFMFIMFIMFLSLTMAWHSWHRCRRRMIPTNGYCFKRTNCCITGTICDSTSRKCKVPVGDKCDCGKDCVTGATCDGGACRIISGGGCNNSEQCETGVTCDNGICRIMSGGGCNNSEQCETGVTCVNGTCNVPVGDKCDCSKVCGTGATCDAGTCRIMYGGGCNNSEQCEASVTCVNGTCNGPAGVFTSPKYPQNYGSNIDRIWHLYAPKGKIIKVDFIDFSVEKTECSATITQSCVWDYVELFEGPFTALTTRGKFCGTGPFSVSFTTNEVAVLFITDSIITCKGFKAEYYFEDP